MLLPLERIQAVGGVPRLQEAGSLPQLLSVLQPPPLLEHREVEEGVLSLHTVGDATAAELTAAAAAARAHRGGGRLAEAVRGEFGGAAAERAAATAAARAHQVGGWLADADAVGSIPPLPSVLLPLPPLERIEVADGVRRLHAMGLSSPRLNVPLPPPLEHIEVAGGLPRLYAVGLLPALLSVLQPSAASTAC